MSAAALVNGALLPIATERELLTAEGIEFQVRVAANLRRKDAQRRRALESAFEPASRGSRSSRGPRPNPFLPPDPALYVAALPPHHMGLLNKFAVLEHHLLIVTRDFAPQQELLTPGDFQALRWCLQQVDGVGFYNGGVEAGASQPHKHLQLVPLPRDATGPPNATGPRFPMEPVWERAPAGGGVVLAPALGFPHGLSRLAPELWAPDADAGAAARGLHQRYLALLAHVGLAAPEGQRRQPGPYNLLVTRQWMLLVPRLAEHFEGISLNGLAYAGSLFVRHRDQLEALRAAGPMRALRAVTGRAP